MNVRVDVRSKLPALARRDRASQVVRNTALAIEATAKQMAPVDTGNLRNSIQTTVVSALRATVGTNVEYAPYIEYGTSRMAAQPFLTPAAERERPAFRRALRLLYEGA
jgi:HK97 gp10 family phage protein